LCSDANSPDSARPKNSVSQATLSQNKRRSFPFYQSMKTPPIDGWPKPDSRIVLAQGDALDALQRIPDHFAKLVITSPPYNLGKEYEKRMKLDDYIGALHPVLEQLVRVLSPSGSLCWQVGNYVQDSEVFPLDIYFYPIFKRLGLQLRNRVIWHFGHGLHCTYRFSGRYETLLWFTKTDDYTFNLDHVRVPSKYPGKTHYKQGPLHGKPSGNPLGKNPSDVWRIMQQDWESGFWEIPNVKANHPGGRKFARFQENGPRTAGNSTTLRSFDDFKRQAVGRRQK
jgi:adenine-specific DNA-methyltransferase